MPGQQQEKAFNSQSGFYKESLCSSVLSSTSAITDANGSLTQHVLYFAYGEQFVDEYRNSTNSPYLFNGKEYDEETGRYYYGARYYDPRLSLWIGVDPLAGKYPMISPFSYCANNPIVLIDPNGMSFTKFGITNDGEVRQLGKADDKPDELYAINQAGELKSNNHIIVTDKKILPELAKAKGKTVKRDAEGNITESGYRRFASSNNASDVANIFLFAGKNSEKEWALYTSGEKGNKNYTVGTLGNSNSSPTPTHLNLDESKVSSMIHSHFDVFSETAEEESMAGDKVASKTYKFDYYMFGSELDNLYLVGKDGNSYFQGKIKSEKDLLKHMK